LGGKTETIFGLSVPDTLVGYAKKHNITRIIIGKTLRPRWKEIVFGSIVDQMIHKSGDIDVYVVSIGEESDKTPPTSEEPFFPPIPPVQYLESLILVGVVAAFGEFTKTIISQTNLMMLFLMVVVIAAFRRGLYLAIFTAFMSVLAFDFFLVPPYYTFRVSDTEYLITFAGMILVGVTISYLISKAQDYAISAHSREKENAMLYNLAKKLTGALDLSAVISVVISKIEVNFNCQAVILIFSEHSLTVKGTSEGLLVDENEKAVAMWAYTNNAIVGYDTDTLHASRFRFIPIRSRHGVLGVLGIKPEESGGAISPDDGRILEIFADLAALAMERFSP